MYIEYNTNNSGGSFWLTTAQWVALEKAGWRVYWVSEKNGDTYLFDDGDFIRDETGMPVQAETDSTKAGSWLGAKAMSACLSGVTLEKAIEQWEEITGQAADAPGCFCCGQPHNFIEYDDNGKIRYRGPDVDYGFR